MPYCQLFYHLIWSTKNRQPRLTSDIEGVVHGHLRAKAIGLGGMVFAVNGIEDHVHMVVSIPAAVSVSRFVGQIKGVASAKLNQSGRVKEPFFWQDEYGAFSFDLKRLPNYVAYVEAQKHHHAQRSTIPVLERTRDPKSRMVREPQAHYLLEEDSWREELVALD